MPANLSTIFHYPIKALSGNALDEAELVPGAGLPDDRRFAIASGATIDPGDHPRNLRSGLVTLERHGRLAALETRYDPRTCHVTILRKGRPVARSRIDTPTGRMLIEQFLAAYLKDEIPGVPHLVERTDCAFGDTEEPAISLLNLASVRDLERRIVQAPVDPARFRANLLVEGLVPWQETGWLGRRIAIGSAVLEPFAPIGQSEAANVQPGTGTRDLNLPLALMRATGRSDCGVHARVVSAGRIRVGDEVRLLD